MTKHEDIQELWHWQIQRMLAEFLHKPDEARETRIVSYLSSYRLMTEKGWQPARSTLPPLSGRPRVQNQQHQNQ